jgi:uncharacterized MAPEG superfamily protein
MTELHILALSGLLACAQLVAMVVPVNRQLGPDWTSGPRDQPRALSGVAGRMKRAYENQVEGLVLFAVAALCVTLLDASSPLTRGAAAVYLLARVIYIPLYAFGVPIWRSAIWGVGFFATILMLTTALV